MATNIWYTSQDLIVIANPPANTIWVGLPASGTYAGVWSQKDNTGTIIPIGIGGGIPLSEAFTSTVNQQIFTPASFTPTTNSKVYQGGVRITTGFDTTTNPGSVTFTIPQDENTIIIIDQW